MDDKSAIGATISGIVERIRQRGHRLQLRDDDRLDGKRCLITGANRGLGLAVAHAFSERGAHVIAACRSAAPAVSDSSVSLDLGDLDSVQQLPDAVGDVDVLILNAGVVPREARRTRHGFDESFQVNFLGNVLLVDALANNFADGGRIVLVGSESHRSAPPIAWSTFGEFQPWGITDAVEQYGISKLLLQTYAAELARRSAGTLQVHSLCPGAVHTDIGREAPGWAKPALELAMRAFFKAPQEAAIPVVYLACARAIDGQTGVYLHALRRRDPSPLALDRAHGARLWRRSHELLKDVGYACRGETLGN